MSGKDGDVAHFHCNAVTADADFDALELGLEVLFGEEAGEEGPQATFVRVIGPNALAD